ncbi:MAG: DUF4783 domain-containing protein [Bacteroidales bacterium]|nr:DUF4783 domain-containing protein [Bacteroidales bacterium]
MRRIFATVIALVLVLPLLFSSQPAAAQGSGDVFVPIAKYIQKGDADKLSAWFAKNLEIEILGKPTECSAIQAKQIMKSFFEQYPPKSFEIVHKSGNPPMKYAIGTLNTGSEVFRVVLLVKLQPKASQILRIRIERSSL